MQRVQSRVEDGRLLDGERNPLIGFRYRVVVAGLQRFRVIVSGPVELRLENGLVLDHDFDVSLAGDVDEVELVVVGQLYEANVGLFDDVHLGRLVVGVGVVVGHFTLVVPGIAHQCSVDR